MKKQNLVDETLTQLKDFTAMFESEGKLRSVPLKLFIALCLNLIVAPAVLAASGGAISRVNAYAIGLLGLVTVGLAIYLMMVMLQPERF
ncbi:K(+)-transporting ATPase subunit F [Aetokthonos hydrillicola Thurmond2011]|jgi:K+-transporting ATPase KdpF subunit|uniref:K(+)-transporting ATPase subunit F n=1 Tax=Aetokthonos hydrillicola Thurmond2011 TaxID=2712845 RepID=A0AAP5ID42_9CYAN|nr:K(+)-transporting ATPase subunit F [Aetokthonos hydrillicola]MBW4587180.1 K(+)-transporting ATPase subunit F [Aetokthonos hydrillicola CCALA 1050]MDR9899348.1 K(+)-transporting ATPase subunit F [Aetokthonos hydrillicola Thurmond2011]